MEPLTTLAAAIVGITALWLCGLAVAIVMRPQGAERFLSGFASTARMHYAEMALRLVAGGAMIVAAPQLRLELVFRVFGWVVVATTGALLLLPWRWHRSFAARTMPVVLRHKFLLAATSFLLGASVMAALVVGP